MIFKTLVEVDPTEIEICCW